MIDIEIEDWKPISGFVGRYDVSNLGRIRSVERYVRTMKRNGDFGLRLMRSLILKAHSWGANYPGVVLLDSGGIRSRKMVHQIVAYEFIDNPLELKVINHIDADTWNPRADNLEWCTTSHNVKHEYIIGNRASGKQHHFSKLPRDKQGRCLSSR